MIYLDNNATTRVFPGVVDAMRPYLTENYLNPASAAGQFAGLPAKISAARNYLAAVLKADNGDQIVVTSGATESNNLALLGAAEANPNRRHLVISAIEHPSVLEVAAHLESKGFRVTRLPVNSDGVVLPSALHGILTHETLAVAVMLGNNETGVIQPVGQIARLVKDFDPNILIHTDATQAVGKIVIDLMDDLAAVDLLSFSAHKFHGPKGAGGLFVREPTLISPITFGGGQQFGLRPGTENLAALIGMVSALEAIISMGRGFDTARKIRDHIQRRIIAMHPAAFALGASAPRLPNTLCICLPGLAGGDVVDQLAVSGIAISTGSACAHGADKPSHVALAMGLDHSQADACIRVSLSVETTPQEGDAFIDVLAALISSAGIK